VKDITGQKFGRLTAVRPTSERIDRRVVWECSCDCGGTIRLSSKRLLNKDNRSCGCRKNPIFDPTRVHADDNVIRKPYQDIWARLLEKRVS